MTCQAQKPSPANDLWAERLLQAVAEELCRGLGVEHLSAELVADVYARLRDLLASAALPLQGSGSDLSAPGLTNELALAIYLVAASRGASPLDPSLLPSLERTLERALVSSKPVPCTSHPVEGTGGSEVVESSA